MMEKTSNEFVEKTLNEIPEMHSFLHCEGRGFLFSEILDTRVIFFREEVGVSYYFPYPFMGIESLKSLREFMEIAIPYMSSTLEKNRKKRLMDK